MPRGRKARAKTKAGYMISAVAEMYNVHPQTLRLYEREGLLSPSRSEGNTRLYTEEDLERLEVILSLTRDLGVNLAGIEIILNMRARMKEVEREVQALVDYMQHELAVRGDWPQSSANALVRVGRFSPILKRSVRAG
jgi:MerR family transcriptional regulator, heat shock protein HspR